MPHDRLYLPPKFCISYRFQMLFEYTVIPGQFENNNLGKIWGAKQTLLGGFEGTKLLNSTY